MTVLIKLIYGSSIQKNIGEEHVKSLSSLDKNVDEIFQKMQWKGSFLEDSKRHAIKSFLKKQISIVKTENLNTLLPQINEKIKECNLDIS
ncbi:hypothetical protein JQC65_26405, partial [Escherichia coli]|uniref:hypothetical protein n=1 Tax=Escherichia coli TaxID=562 RepID=UPI001CBFC3EE